MESLQLDDDFGEKIPHSEIWSKYGDKHRMGLSMRAYI